MTVWKMRRWPKQHLSLFVHTKGVSPFKRFPHSLFSTNHVVDPSQKALLGGNWNLHADYFTAMIRAIALEGEVFVVQPQGSDEILSISLWTEPDHDMFSTLVTLHHSIRVHWR